MNEEFKHMWTATGGVPRGTFNLRDSFKEHLLIEIETYFNKHQLTKIPNFSEMVRTCIEDIEDYADIYKGLEILKNKSKYENVKKETEEQIAALINLKKTINSASTATVLKTPKLVRNHLNLILDSAEKILPELNQVLVTLEQKKPMSRVKDNNKVHFAALIAESLIKHINYKPTASRVGLFISLLEMLFDEMRISGGIDNYRLASLAIQSGYRQDAENSGLSEFFVGGV